MGSIESGLPLKRDLLHLPRSASIRSTNGVLGQRSRSRFARLVLFKKVNYLQLICTVAVFFFFVFLLQMFFLPGSVMEDERKSDKIRDLFGDVDSSDLLFLKELDFGQDVNFEPLKIMDKFRKDWHEVNVSVGSRNVVRFGHVKPKLAFVSCCSD